MNSPADAVGHPDAADPPDPPAPWQDRLFEELAARLDRRESRRIPPEETGRRAAVALLLAGGEDAPALAPVLDPDEAGDPAGAGDSAGASQTAAPRGVLPDAWRRVHALLILRPRVEGDPWAGHVALPGGKREPGDPDLVDTARRETAEETGLRIARGDVLGRLSDLHPRSARLPDLSIRPYVARWRGQGELELSHEVEEAFWVPLVVLADRARRSELVLERREGRRRFPTIEIGGHTVWGLTHAILEDFLSVITDRPPPER